MSVIVVDKLSAFYENQEVFNELSFSIDEGDYLSIVGENGSGKTTLMRCVLGLTVKHKGSVILNGFTRKEIGWLPQKSEAQKDFPASVSEVVMSGFSGSGLFGIFYSRSQKKTAEKNMKLLEIYQLKNKSFRELSGGQQQKVLLCRALCSSSKVLLLDEPVTGLDEASQEELYSIISRLNNSGMTIIMISHDIKKAVTESNKILQIGEKGYFFGNTSEYLSNQSDNIMGGNSV